MQHYIWAFSIGGLSAVSLLIGSILGSYWKPGKLMTSTLTAFGAGALLSALAIELVAPTVMSILHTENASHVVDHREAMDQFVMLIIGCVAGGVLFIILDQLINQKGGYLRKSATTIAFASQRQKARYKKMLTRLSRIEILNSLPPDHLSTLVNSIFPRSYSKEEMLFPREMTVMKCILLKKAAFNCLMTTIQTSMF